MVLGRVAPGGGVVKDHAVAVEYSPMTTPTTTLDLVIRGGLIVDGTGAPARRGDVAVPGGRLAEVGGVTGRGQREIDADGLVIAPGFTDPHAHYDADPRTIADHEPELVHDLPGGGPRLVQRASGILWSFVNGHPVIQEGRMPDRPDPSEGRGPGRVIRAA
jgi:N-acyl-D-aspartate/D-glutamate deacylase